MRIIVMQNHIDKGRPDNCQRCPIALAIIAAIPDATWVFVDCALVKINTLRTRDVYFLPAKAQQFIADFDHYVTVQPFEFKLV